MAIVTEKLQKHEESRPGFLSRELKARLELVKAVYPSDHPNYHQLWVDMVTRYCTALYCTVLYCTDRGHQDDRPAPPRTHPGQARRPLAAGAGPPRAPAAGLQVELATQFRETSQYLERIFKDLC